MKQVGKVKDRVLLSYLLKELELAAIQSNSRNWPCAVHDSECSPAYTKIELAGIVIWKEKHITSQTSENSTHGTTLDIKT